MLALSASCEDHFPGRPERSWCPDLNPFPGMGFLFSGILIAIAYVAFREAKKAETVFQDRLNDASRRGSSHKRTATEATAHKEMHEIFSKLDADTLFIYDAEAGVMREFQFDDD